MLGGHTLPNAFREQMKNKLYPEQENLRLKNNGIVYQLTPQTPK